MNYLLINLAVADMMVALFVAPRFLLSHLFTHPAGATGTLFCKLLTGGNLTWTGGAASVFTRNLSRARQPLSRLNLTGFTTLTSV